MAKTPLSGKAQTVLGPVDGDTMGITLPHEHLLIDFKVMFKEPEAAADKGRALAPVTMANLGWVRQNFSSSLDNLRLLDEDVARDEALLFKQAGGQTMVDPTNGGLARDPAALARIARATGLHIVMGAGYYVQAAHPPALSTRSVDDIAREIVADLTVGVGDTGVRAGLIGEIGCTWPWTDDEKKVVRAAVAAQRETGAPLMIHPGRNPRAPIQILEVVGKEGGNLSGPSCATSTGPSPTGSTSWSSPRPAAISNTTSSGSRRPTIPTIPSSTCPMTAGAWRRSFASSRTGTRARCSCRTTSPTSIC